MISAIQRPYAQALPIFALPVQGIPQDDENSETESITELEINRIGSHTKNTGLDQETISGSTRSVKKPYKCTAEGCSKAFVKASHWTAHTRTHTGERPYKCTVEGCSQVFALKNSLAEHTRTRTDARPIPINTSEGLYVYIWSKNQK